MKKEVTLREHMSRIGKLSWKKKLDLMTSEEIKERMSKMGKLGADNRWK
jgi:hypothetical protein